MRVETAVLAVAMLAVLARPAAAGPCDEAEARLAFVSKTLHADARAGRIHEWGWALGNGAIGIGLVGVGLAADDRGARAEAYIGAGGSALAAVLPSLLQRLPAIRDAPRLERMLATTPEGPARCALVAEADRLLARSARDERAARGVAAHAVNVLINGGGWLILGFGWDRWRTGGIGALLSIALGEIQIYTRPTGAMRAWSVAPAIGPDRVGLVLGRRF